MLHAAHTLRASLIHLSLIHLAYLINAIIFFVLTALAYCTEGLHFSAFIKMMIVETFWKSSMQWLWNASMNCIGAIKNTQKVIVGIGYAESSIYTEKKCAGERN